MNEPGVFRSGGQDYAGRVCLFAILAVLTEVPTAATNRNFVERLRLHLRRYLIFKIKICTTNAYQRDVCLSVVEKIQMSEKYVGSKFSE